jgi:pyruvate dehydrogenase E2 component (dihydrolipoamide acetyltransferase)
MSVELQMPSLGADMTEGTLVEWRVAAGQAIHRGQVLMLVETDKGVIDVESFHDGLVERLLVEPGTRVAVGAPVALLAGEPATAAPGGRATPGTPAPAVAPPAVPASPAARRRAAELGVDLAKVTPGGQDGVITLADVLRAAQPASPQSAPPQSAAEAPAPVAGAPQAATAEERMRRAIGAAMSRAKREIPHYYLADTVDFTPLLQRVAAHNAREPVERHVLYNVLLFKAVATAAAAVPGFSGWWRSGRFEPAPVVQVGVAVAHRGGGVVAPALLDVATRGPVTLTAQLRDLVARARTGHLRQVELDAPTITVSSLGEDAADTIYPIVNPEQVAIVGAGSPVLRPWVVGERIEPRTVVSLTLAADHRVTDGRAGARFLRALRRALASQETS